MVEIFYLANYPFVKFLVSDPKSEQVLPPNMST